MGTADSIEELRRAHSDTLSVISHDIRAPLGVILGALGELINPALGALTDDQRALLSLVRRSGEKLARLANNVMVLQRLELGPLEMPLQRSDLRVLVPRVVDIFQRSGDLERVQIQVTLPEEPVLAEVNVERWSHAFSNVLANAVRFVRKTVDVSLAAREGRAELTVDDDGPGVPPDAMASLFDGTRRPRAPGRPPPGLGLPVAKAIAEGHRGGIEVLDKTSAGTTPPRGARFVLWLPVAHAKG